MVPIQKQRALRRHGTFYDSSPIRENMLPSKPHHDPPVSPMVTVLIGPKQHSFRVNRNQLCAASPFFRDQLEESPNSRPVTLWLPSESVSMFTLFVEWVHQGPRFRRWLDDAAFNAHETSEEASHDIHWAIIRLHLFAAALNLFELQDLAMDAVQDLYLRCDWDAPPTLISYLYTKCEALASVRLRRWAVAMVAFSLTGGSHPKLHPQESETSDAAMFQTLLDGLPEFAADYAVHMHKMTSSGLDVRFKNPQLRIPANKLRNEERGFGFRQCSFHSHRARVGQHRCPHTIREIKRRRRAHESSSSSDESGLEYEYDLSKRHSDCWADGLTSPTRHDKPGVPAPLFARGALEGEEEAVQRTLKHARSISSTLDV